MLVIRVTLDHLRYRLLYSQYVSSHWPIISILTRKTIILAEVYSVSYKNVVNSKIIFKKIILKHIVRSSMKSVLKKIQKNLIKRLFLQSRLLSKKQKRLPLKKNQNRRKQRKRNNFYRVYTPFVGVFFYQLFATWAYIGYFSVVASFLHCIWVWFWCFLKKILILFVCYCENIFLQNPR